MSFLLLVYKWLKGERVMTRVKFGENGLVAGQLGLITEELK